MNDEMKELAKSACRRLKGINPVVHLWEKIYEKGVRLTKKAMKPYENRIERSNILPKWYVTIPPPI